MKHIFTLSLLLFSCSLFSQNWLSAESFGSTADDILSDLEITPTQQIITSGILADTTQIGAYQLLPDGNSSFGYIAKFDDQMNPQWAKAIHVNLGHSPLNPIFDFHNTSSPDNSIYLSSQFADTIAFGTDTLLEERGGTFLTRLDSLGNYLWARNFGQADQSGSMAMQLSSSAVDVFGNVYLSGAFIDTAFFRSDTLIKKDGGLFVVKFDQNGDEQWVRQCGGRGNNNRAFDIEGDEDGGIYVTGTISGESYFGMDTLDVSPNESISFISKMSDDGNFMWTRFGGSITSNPPVNTGNGAHGIGVAVADEGWVYNTGFYTDTVMFSGQLLNPTCGNNNCKNFYLAAYDKDGNFKWIRQANATNNLGSVGYDMVIDPNGHVFVAGGFIGDIAFGGQSTSFDNWDNFIAKFDSTGTCRWLLNGGGDYRNFRMDAHCPDSNIVVGTSYKGPAGNLGFSGLPTADSYDCAVLEFGSDFNCMVIASDVKEQTLLPAVSIYPNPTSGQLFVEMPDTYNTNGQLVLMDMFGRVQQSMDAACAVCEMDVNSLPNGVYFVVWKGENGEQSKARSFVKN